VVHRCAKERVPEFGPLVHDPDQPGALRRVQDVAGQAMQREDGVDAVHRTGVVGRDEEERVPRARREPLHRAPEGPLDRLAHRQGDRQRLATGQLSGRQQRRHLDQRERAAARERDELFGNVVRERGLIEATSQQRERGGRLQASQRHLLEPAEVEMRVVVGPRRQDHRDPVRPKAARREQEGLGGRDVHPLDVVCADEDRPILGRLTDQGQDGGVRDETIDAGSGRDPERDLEGGALQRREAVAVPEDGAAGPDESRERQVCLGLDPNRRAGLEARRALTGVGKEGRFAHPRLAPNDDAAAVPVTSAGNQNLEPPSLVLPPHEHGAMLGPLLPDS
jgi:hypothetical protein